MIRRTLLSTNILAIIVILFLGYSYWQLRKAYIKAFDLCKYKINQFDLREQNGDIVMMGDSFMLMVSWDSLLNRHDVINGGVFGDKMHCVCERITESQQKFTKIYFINVGINDFPDATVDTVSNYYRRAVEFCQRNHKIAVLNTLPYISSQAYLHFPFRKDYKRINKMVYDLNARLKALAIEKKIDCIDLNQELQDGNKLVIKDEFTTDGVHLKPAAYRIWAKKIEEILKKNSI